MTARKIQRFEVLDQLGRGGMAHVFRARDPQLDREVAIKVLAEPSDSSSELSPDQTLDLRREAPTTADDLLREARIMAQLSHQNVLPVYEVGLSDGCVFVVMEHIAGCNLREWLTTPRTTNQICAVFAQAGRGLASAHERGIVHRDFKPDNVLIGNDGRARVADFGLSGLATRALGAMVRLDDGRGTPKYMAPELWLGEPASIRSDVYAFCAAFAEASACELDPVTGRFDTRGLRERVDSVRIRTAINAGLDADPDKRPALSAVIAALESRRFRRWGLAATGVLALVAGVAITAVVGGADAAAACEHSRDVFAKRWDADRKAALERRLSSAPEIIRAFATLDDQKREITLAREATCTAVQRGDLDNVKARARASCLERRAIELGAIVDLIERTSWSPARIEVRVRLDATAAECDAITTPPIEGDRRPIVALWNRFVSSADLPPDAAQIELPALVRSAGQLGETELEARTLLRLGSLLGSSDQPTRAGETLDITYRRASEIHADALAATALVEHSRVAARAGDVGSARAYAVQARALADQANTSPTTQARAYAALGHADVLRADYAGALDNLQKGLVAAARAGRSQFSTELAIRFDMIQSLTLIDGRARDAVNLARETVELVRAANGERDPNLAVALNLLATAYDAGGNIESGLPFRRQALDITTAAMPPGHSAITLQRADLANALLAAGHLAEGRKLLQQSTEEAASNPALQVTHASLLADLAVATFDTGDYAAGIANLQCAIDELVKQHGSAELLDRRRQLIHLQLELGRIDDAARELAAVEQLTAEADNSALELARLYGIYAARLALARGQARNAESFAREALYKWDELHGAEADRIDLWHTLGTSLLAQRRLGDARTALEMALSLANAQHVRADRLAAIEVQLAKLENAEGHHADAVARARRASEVLDHFPGAVLPRKAVGLLIH